MDPEIANYMKERAEKQNFLKSEIQEMNYNVAEFAQFLEWKRGMSKNFLTFPSNLSIFKDQYSVLELSIV